MTTTDQPDPDPAHDLLREILAAQLAEGHEHRRVLPDGRTLIVHPLLFGRARLCLGTAGSGVYDDEWDYDAPAAAVAACDTWDGTGEPEGWMRHHRSGRRRPGGDPAKEYVRP